MLYKLLRPLLFTLDAEKAHELSLYGLDKTAKLLPNIDLDSNPTRVMDLVFPNKVGLAAGLDKNGAHIDGLGKFGFGFIEVGTVTPRPQAGNSKPRLFRIQSEQAIINRMGFNNDGVDKLLVNIKDNQYQGMLGINIGKNKDTPNEDALLDYLTALQKVYPVADYISVNISSPNTAGLRELQNTDSLQALIVGLKESQLNLSKEHGYKPITIKIAPDLSDKAVRELATILKSHEIDGVIATNTTIDKSSIAHHPLATEQGGLSGLPVREQSTHVIKLLRHELGKGTPIIGVGGIMSGDDAVEKLNAGANLIQLYSGLIYHGPALVKSIIRQTQRI